MYLTYEQYTLLGGTLDETTFCDLEFEAESIINWYTFNRLCDETEFSDKVKRLMFKLINLINKKQQAMNLGVSADSNDQSNATIASQSNDGFSTTYNVLSASDVLNASESEMKILINHYLQGEVNSLGHKLLFRGIYPNE